MSYAKQDTESLYTLAGMALRSDVCLDLRSAPHGGSPPVVDIRRVAALPGPPSDAVSDPFGAWTTSTVWLRDPANSCSCSVTTGQVRYVRRSHHSDVETGSFLSRALPAAFVGLGVLSFHASAVVIRGRAYVFMGRSGAGKSTCCTALSLAGGQLLADDTVMVTFDEKRSPMIWGHERYSALRRDSQARFGLHSPFLTLGNGKQRYRLPRSAAGQGYPLASVTVLSDVSTEQETKDPSDRVRHALEHLKFARLVQSLQGPEHLMKVRALVMTGRWLTASSRHVVPEVSSRFASRVA